MSAKALIIATAALAATAAAPVLAAEGPPEGDPPLRAAVMFNLVDRDGNGVIDKDEVGAVTTAILAAIDANGDGTLTKEELGDLLGRVHKGGGFGFERGAGLHHGDDDDWHGGYRSWWRMGPDDQSRPMGPPAGDTARGGPGPMMGPGTGAGPGAGMSPGAGPRMPDFASLDSNGDGVISPDEYAAAAPIVPGMGPPR
ncbi:MAG: EF-hand domain-containing protein [Bauldia sp.]